MKSFARSLPRRTTPIRLRHLSTSAPSYATPPPEDKTVAGRSPFQAFVDVLRDEVRKNREWQDSVKQLAGERDKVADSETMKKAREVYERARVGHPSTGAEIWEAHFLRDREEQEGHTGVVGIGGVAQPELPPAPNPFQPFSHLPLLSLIIIPHPFSADALD